MDLNNEKRKNCDKYTHVEFIEIYNYLSDKNYPERITDKGMKANFRRACQNFGIVNNELRYKRKRKDGSATMVRFWPG